MSSYLSAGERGVPLTIDRFRVKPYEVLAGEFTRVLGNDASMLSALQESGAAPWKISGPLV